MNNLTYHLEELENVQIKVKDSRRKEVGTMRKKKTRDQKLKHTIEKINETKIGFFWKDKQNW